MKKIMILMCTFLLAVIVNAQTILNETLPNGMEVVVKENSSNTSVAMYCFVKTGSIHEGDYLGKGLSHYLEHIVSGGATSKHTEEEYAEMVKEIGAMVNAYTIYGVTAYHIQSDNAHIDKALQILAENISDCALDSNEIIREKDVILKEFVYRVSPPMTQVRNRDTYNAFQTSNVRHEVIGNIELFKSVTRDELVDYYNKRYAPNNMIFVAAGNFDAQEMLQKIKDAFSDFERRVVQPVYLPEERVRTGTYKYVEEFDIQTYQGRITTVLDNADYSDFIALDMATDILFSKRTSPVQYRLNEELQLVNWIYGYFNDGGKLPEPMLKIAFETMNPENLDIIVEEIDAEIERVLARGIKQGEIDEIIKQYKAQKLMSTPSADEECEEIGWNMIQYGAPEVFETFIEQYQALTPADIEAAIKKYYLPKNRVIFYGVPLGEKSKIQESGEEIVKTDITKIELPQNTTLLHKQNTQAPIIDGALFIPVSAKYETIDNVGLIDFMATLMLKGGSPKYKAIDLSSWLEGHAATLYPLSGNEGTTIYFKCIKDDLPTMIDMITDLMNNPVFDENELVLMKKYQEASFQRSISDPETAHTDFRNSVLYPNQKSGISEAQKNDIIQNITRDDLITLHKNYFNADRAIITLIGDITLDEAKEKAILLRNKIPNKSIKGELTSLVVPDTVAEYINEYQFEPCNVNINYKAPDRNSPDFYTMKVIELLLGYSGKRLHKATRQDDNLAYFAYAQYVGDSDYGFFRLISQTSAPNKDRLLTVLKSEIERLKNGDVTQEDIDAAVSSYESQIKSYFTDDKLASTITHYESTGQGYNFMLDSVNDMMKITPEMIKEAANKYFAKGITIISLPSEDVELKLE